jgi:FKBP-type peptidyl-prolyl cis-trans isomerase
MKASVLVLLSLTATAACNSDVAGLGPPSDPATETFAPTLNVDISTMTQLPGGTYMKDLVVGTGDSVTAQTDTVWVTYAGFLKDGTLFKAETNRKFQPIQIDVAGFRGGMIGMRVGGRRQLVIPSVQAYGPTSQRGDDGKILIPRQSTLIIEVTLLNLHQFVPPPTPEP